jgi:phage baseplate assembly protein W
MKNTQKYSDLDLMFTPHPITGDIIPLKGDDAVIASVKNLVLTNFYERPFHSEIGSGVLQHLFENATSMTAQKLKTKIGLVIKNFEPRVSMQNIDVQLTPDNNSFQVTMTFFIKNQTLPVTITQFLKRTR